MLLLFVLVFMLMLSSAGCSIGSSSARLACSHGRSAAAGVLMLPSEVRASGDLNVDMFLLAIRTIILCRFEMVGVLN